MDRTQKLAGVQAIVALVLVAAASLRAGQSGVAWPVVVLVGISLLAAFITGININGHHSSARFAYGWLAVLSLVWLVSIAVSQEYVWLSFLLWLLAGHVLPWRWALPYSVAIYAAVLIAELWHAGRLSFAFAFGPLVGCLFALGFSRGYLVLLREARNREELLTELTAAQQQTASLQDELAVTQRQAGVIAERTRLSRDIHDTVAQTLSSIRLLANAGAASSDDPHAVTTMRQIEALAGDGSVAVRRLVAALAPTELAHALAPALQRMLTQLQEQTRTETSLHVDASLPVLSTATEVALLRTAQSALANARLHAHAKKVVVSLIDDDDMVRLDVIDDGVGFDVIAWEQSTRSQTASFGLRFMRSRLRELGGGLEIESTPGEGTALSAYLPLVMAVEEGV